MKKIIIKIINYIKCFFAKKEYVEKCNQEIQSGIIVADDVENLGCSICNNQASQNVSKKVILIDNGHGFDTKGKRTPYLVSGAQPKIELYEWKWNREIASEIVKTLKSKGYDARLLVTEDKDISLTERYKRANEICNKVGKNNVILISIHGNASGNGKEWKSANGWSAYTTKGNTNSDKLAEFIYTEADKNFKGRKIRRDKSDGDSDWEENFTIIYKTYCPAVLTENFFYDNANDAEYMLSNEGRTNIVKTHVDGIINYLNSF